MRLANDLGKVALRSHSRSDQLLGVLVGVGDQREVPWQFREGFIAAVPIAHPSRPRGSLERSITATPESMRLGRLAVFIWSTTHIVMND